MVTATLDMKPSTDIRECWDNLTLIVNGTDTVIPFIVFRNRKSALDLAEKLLLAEVNGIEGDMKFEYEGQKFTLSEESRPVVRKVVTEFTVEYTLQAYDNGEFG